MTNGPEGTTKLRVCEAAVPSTPQLWHSLAHLTGRTGGTTPGGGSLADLVGHGGGPHFASNCFLLEVPQTDVAPHIPVKIQQDGVEAHDHAKQLGDVVMRLYLQHDTTWVLLHTAFLYLPP